MHPAVMTECPHCDEPVDVVDGLIEPHGDGMAVCPGSLRPPPEETAR